MTRNSIELQVHIKMVDGETEVFSDGIGMSCDGGYEDAVSGFAEMFAYLMKAMLSKPKNMESARKEGI